MQQLKLNKKQETILADKVFKDFIKRIPTNFKGVGVTFASLVFGNNKLLYLSVKQSNEEVRFYFDDISPWASFEDLKVLEKRMMDKL